jgi:hypothetical protein
LEVTGIVLTGRARARRRRYLAAGGATAMVLAAAAALPVAVDGWRAGPGLDPPPPGGASPLPALDCETTGLEPPDHPERGTPDPSHVWVRAMDPTGRYVLANWVSGEVTGTDDPPVVVLWDTEDGSATYLPTLQGGADGQAVNGSGAVVGSDWDEAAGYAWIYRDGDLQTLPVPAGYQGARAEGVNEPGDVVGTASGENGDSVVVVWPADDLEHPEVLPPPPGVYAAPAGITDAGAVVATVGIDGRDVEAYVWDADREFEHRIPPPNGTLGGYVSAVRGDWAVGAAYLPAAEASLPPTPVVDELGEQVAEVPVRWDLAAGTVELIDAGSYPVTGAATAVTAAGDVVVGATEPVVVRDGLAYTLPVPDEGGQPQPVAVSEDGTVFAGTVESAPEVSRPTVWRCR